MKRFISLILATGLLVVVCDCAHSTLILAIDNPNAVYIASDSLMTVPDSGERRSVRKIFPVTETCMVALGGWYGATFLETNPSNSETVQLGKDLERICTNSIAGDQSTKITNILDQFTCRYNNVRNKVLSHKKKMEMPTFVLFAGHDELKGFFGSVCILGMPHRPENLESVFTITNRTGHYTVMASENQSILNLMYDPTKFPESYTPLSMSLRQLNEGVPFSDAATIDLILQIFQFHKDFDKGPIDVPYVIYKLTKTGTKRLR